MASHLPLHSWDGRINEVVCQVQHPENKLVPVIKVLKCIKTRPKRTETFRNPNHEIFYRLRVQASDRPTLSEIFFTRLKTVRFCKALESEALRVSRFLEWALYELPNERMLKRPSEFP